MEKSSFSPPSQDASVESYSYVLHLPFGRPPPASTRVALGARIEGRRPVMALAPLPSCLVTRRRLFVAVSAVART